MRGQRGRGRSRYPQGGPIGWDKAVRFGGVCNVRPLSRRRRMLDLGATPGSVGLVGELSAAPWAEPNHEVRGRGRRLASPYRQAVFAGAVVVDHHGIGAVPCRRVLVTAVVDLSAHVLATVPCHGLQLTVLPFRGVGMPACVGRAWPTTVRRAERAGSWSCRRQPCSTHRRPAR